jgi:hypothetical protein
MGNHTRRERAGFVVPSARRITAEGSSWSVHRSSRCPNGCASDGQLNQLAEVVFVAELADDAWRRRPPIDLQRVWFDGHITADLPCLVMVRQGWAVPIRS